MAFSVLAIMPVIVIGFYMKAADILPFAFFTNMFIL